MSSLQTFNGGTECLPSTILLWRVLTATRPRRRKARIAVDSMHSVRASSLESLDGCRVEDATENLPIVWAIHVRSP
jgi:hypothetical protein